MITKQLTCYLLRCMVSLPYKKVPILLILENSYRPSRINMTLPGGKRGLNGMRVSCAPWLLWCKFPLSHFLKDIIAPSLMLYGEEFSVCTSHDEKRHLTFNLDIFFVEKQFLLNSSICFQFYVSNTKIARLSLAYSLCRIETDRTAMVEWYFQFTTYYQQSLSQSSCLVPVQLFFFGTFSQWRIDIEFS